MTQLHFLQALGAEQIRKFWSSFASLDLRQWVKTCFVGFPKFGISTYPKWGSHSYKQKDIIGSTDWNTIQIRRSGINFKSLRLTLFRSRHFILCLQAFTPIKLHCWYRFTRGIVIVYKKLDVVVASAAFWAEIQQTSWNFIWNSYFISFCVCFVLHK